MLFASLFVWSEAWKSGRKDIFLHPESLKNILKIHFLRLTARDDR